MTVNLEQVLQGVDTLKNMGLRILEQSPNRLRVELPQEKFTHQSRHPTSY